MMTIVQKRSRYYVDLYRSAPSINLLFHSHGAFIQHMMVEQKKLMWHKWAEKTASSFCRLKSGKQNIEKYPNYIKLLLLFLTRKLRHIPSEVPEDTFRLNTWQGLP